MVFEQERRYSSRIQFGQHADLSFDSEVYTDCYIHNLSLTGMFVHGEFQQNERDHCVVTFIQKKKYSCLSFEASARVQRKDDNGVAIEFTSISLDSLMLLQLILAHKDGDDFLKRQIESFDSLPFKVLKFIRDDTNLTPEVDDDLFLSQTSS